MPTEKIRIEGSKFEYEINHPIVLTCLSAPSKPAMKLSWFINEKPVEFLFFFFFDLFLKL